jgi:hypothetical protein
MKTITEYQPLIFSRILRHAAPRKILGIDRILTLVELAGGLWLSIDTGFAPWQWQFWLMFAPFFAAGELAMRAVHAK